MKNVTELTVFTTINRDNHSGLTDLICQETIKVINEKVFYKFTNYEIDNDDLITEITSYNLKCSFNSYIFDFEVKNNSNIIFEVKKINDLNDLLYILKINNIKEI